MPKGPKGKLHSIKCLRSIEGFVGSRIKLARQLRVTPQAIANWTFAGRIPAKYIVTLAKLSDGKVSTEELLGSKD